MPGITDESHESQSNVRTLIAVIYPGVRQYPEASLTSEGRACSSPQKPSIPTDRQPVSFPARRRPLAEVHVGLTPAFTGTTKPYNQVIYLQELHDQETLL